MVGGGCLRPGVSLGLVDVDGNILAARPLGIVDSGCDFTTFPVEWGERLGIDTDSDCLRQEGETAGGTTAQHLYVAGIDVLFLGKRLLLSATFAPLCPHVLLGREDFFRYFKSISFDQSKEKLHLEVLPIGPRRRRRLGKTSNAWGCGRKLTRKPKTKKKPSPQCSPDARVFEVVPSHQSLCQRAPGPEPSALIFRASRRSLRTSRIVARLMPGRARSMSRRRNTAGA